MTSSTHMKSAPLPELELPCGTDARSNPNSDIRFVAQLYQDLFQRPAYSNELKLHGNLLRRGFSRRHIVLAVISSTDYRVHLVQTTHRALLGRSAGVLELSRLVPYLAAGGTAANLKVSLLESEEYFNSRGGGTNAGFLVALYKDVLGRAFDPARGDIGGRLLETGAQRSYICFSLVASEAAHEVLVRGWFSRFFHRTADLEELRPHVRALQMGNLQEAIIAELLTSDEYATN